VEAVVADVVSSVVELAVGIACLVAAVGTWRRAGSSRVWALGFLVAGVAAAVHAVIALA
jgi:hypothetical protein